LLLSENKTHFGEGVSKAKKAYQLIARGPEKTEPLVIQKECLRAGERADEGQREGREEGARKTKDGKNRKKIFRERRT